MKGAPKPPHDGVLQRVRPVGANAQEAPLRHGATARVRPIGDGHTREAGLMGGRAHEVRLIGGRWKRSKLPVRNHPGLRPTPDRVRETLFNWLGQDLTGWHCLDAFAGSGALGFEAASRGAARVLLVEREVFLCTALRQVKDRLGAEAVEVVCANGLAVLTRRPDTCWDLVFLDPPYAEGLLQPALVAAERAVRPGGFIYAEDHHPLDAPAGCLPYRQGRAGAVWYHLFRRCVDTERG